MICAPQNHRESPSEPPHGGYLASRRGAKPAARWSLRRLTALLLLPALVLAPLSGCGSASEQVRLGEETIADEPRPLRYAAALRLAAVARVQARAGLDELASEHFRAAYRKHADAAFLLAGAEAAERARLFAESSDMLRQALTHDLARDQRQKAETNLARVAPQVPAGLVRVPIQVAPEGARVELTRTTSASARKPDSRPDSKPDRIVLTSGWVFLQTGTWSIYTTARGYQPELQTVQVTKSGAGMVQVALRPEDTGPSVADPSRPKRDDRSIAVPGPTPEEPEPSTTDVAVKPDPDPEPEVVKPMPRPDPVRDPDPGPVVEKPKPKPKPVVVKPKPKPPVDPTDPELDPGEGPTVELDVAYGPQGIHKWGPYATAGVGVALVGLGGFFGFQAQQSGQEASDLGSQNLSDSQYKSQFNTLVGQAEDQALYANLAFAGGGLLLAAGTAWWWFAPVAEPAKARPAASGERASRAVPPDRPAWLPHVLATPRAVGLSWTF